MTTNLSCTDTDDKAWALQVIYVSLIRTVEIDKLSGIFTAVAVYKLIRSLIDTTYLKNWFPHVEIILR